MTVFHIGANKTGSTTLQRRLFPHLPGILYLGEDGEHYAEQRARLDSLVWDDDLYYRREEVRRLFESYRKAAGDRTFLYSNEDITRSRVPAQCARRLKELAPDAEILLVVRNQLTAVNSWYASHGAYLRDAPAPYFKRYVGFDDWMDHCTRFLESSPLAGFFYGRLAALYAELFGRERVHVLMYEDFAERPGQFIDQLCAILRVDAAHATPLLEGARERTRNTRRRLAYHRFRTHVLWRTPLSRLVPGGRTLAPIWRRFLAGGAPVGDVVTPHWRTRLAALYADDNARLAREFGLPLAARGYPCAVEGVETSIFQ